MLTGVKQRPTLTHDDVTRDHVLIFMRQGAQASCVGLEESYTPENFLTPRRFPGEPP
jgi:hypothetical protein